MSNIELIIFDFDGVIADSEYLFIQADRNAFKHAGIEMSEFDIIHKFIGVDFSTTLKALEQEYGVERSRIYAEQVVLEKEKLIIAELKPVPHVIEFLESCHFPYYIASNGTSRRTKQKIDILGIGDLFEDVIIGVDNVAKPKPAPDMLKLAADKAGIAYDKCVVIEDGIYGLQAARKLNMHALGFTGASHILEDHEQKLSAAGAKLVFDDMRALPTILKEL